MRREDAQYTEYFSNFLEDNEMTEYWQQIKAKFELIPAFNINNIELNMYELFKHKYYNREIGAETESIFAHNIETTINEVLVAYAPKISLWLENFNKTIERVIETGEHTENISYLNPVNVSASKVNAKVEFDTIRTNPTATKYTNAYLLEEIMNLKDIYNDALLTFDTCFMGCF